MRYNYDIKTKTIKKDQNLLGRLDNNGAKQITDELNRQDRRITKYEKTITKIKEALKEWDNIAKPIRKYVKRSPTKHNYDW